MMQTNIFDEQVKTDAQLEIHLQLHLQKLIASILLKLRQASEHNHQIQALFEMYPFINSYEHPLLQLGDGSLERSIALLQDDIDALEGYTKTHLPLKALKDSLLPQYGEIQVFLAAGLVDVDLRFGSLFASLQEPLTSRMPCIGLLSWLLDSEQVDVWSAAQNLDYQGYIAFNHQSEIRSEWLLRVPPPVWDALRGYTNVSQMAQLTVHKRREFPKLNDLILAPEQHAMMMRLPHMLSLYQEQTLVLRGIRGNGRRTVFGAIAREMGRGIIVAEKLNNENQKLLGPLATLTGTLPLVRCHPKPGETVTFDKLAGYTGIVGITVGLAGGIDGKLLDRSVTVRLDSPNLALRRQFWNTSGIQIEEQEYEAILKRFLLAGGTIQRVGQRAQTHAELDGRSTVAMVDVQSALRTLNLQALETLATPLKTGGGWERLVVSTALHNELQLLEMRCRQRETLQSYSGIAFENNLNRGVRALLSGESGTGKTLAARVLASVLGMDIFRVDLAAVVNKFIGETERNLNEVFSRAEELDVILLLDEGDSLLTQRTDVSTSNDRYANLETNYLLQRLEQYEGIVFITTNAVGRIDEAFMRRFDAIIEFASPEAEERLALFRLHLPQDHQVSGAFLHQIAYRCRLNGGQIRNVSLHAMLLAIEGDMPVHDAHLTTALQTVYRREGLVYPFTSRSRQNGS